ncbi:MAG: aspartate kinase [Acidobacteria bacterium]|nr:aspartate kinase [Acidobacteriota bacterium]
MNVLVQKYGGTSVGTPERILRVADRILAARRTGVAVVSVVSAMGHTTDELMEMARKVTPNPPRRELAMLLTTGEQISISLLCMAIQAKGARAVALTGLQSGIITDTNYADARIKRVRTQRLRQHLAKGEVVIVAGYQGVSNGTEITTLGRGGSDTTAAALAAALGARTCEIYTDVEGVYTADPRQVPNAARLDYIAYEEMLELAGSGAQVMHPRAVEIAMRFGFPLLVKPSYSDGAGTVITEGSKLESVAITGVTTDKDIGKIAIQKVPDRPGIAAKILSALARERIHVRLIIQSVNEGNVNDVTIVVKREFIERASAVLERMCRSLKASGVVCDPNMAEISIVGSGIASTSGVAARMFKALARKNINIDLISTSTIRIACVIDRRRVDDAVRAVHDEFKLGRLKRRAV